MTTHQPWLKSMIFWIILVVVLVLVFQCSTREQKNKAASNQNFERLYHCVRDLDLTKHPELSAQLQHLDLTTNQQDIMQLIQQCRQLKPIADKASYLTLIQQQTHQSYRSNK